MVSAAFPNRPFNLRDNVWWISHDIPNNRSLVGFELWIDKTAYSPTFSDGIAHRWMRLNGTYVHESYGTGYNFVSGSNFLLASGTAWVGHNADGTINLFIEASANYALLGSTALSVTIPLPTLPRASTTTFAVPGNLVPGVARTLNTNRASSSFTHDIYYAFGNTGWVGIAGGVGASVSWTPPLNLMSQIPNATGGYGTILTYTFSGGTLIGSTTSTFFLEVPASVIPTWTSVALSEDNTAVATQVGAFVQGLSKLDYTITGAAGVYGSSITLQRFSVAGQTVDGASGTTSQTISSSGVVPATFLIQDSRGRQKLQTNNINVLPYSAPVISSFQARRSLNDGTLDVDDGTYLRIDLSAQVQSLINVVQKNIIQIKVYSRVRGTTPWTLKQTLNPSGISYNSFAVISGPYAVDTSYEVRVEVLDRFSTSAALATISVAQVFMHWGNGLGVGKYHENGMLDVAGDIYVSGGIYTGGMSLGLLDPEYVGPGPARVYNLDNMSAGLSTNAYEWEGEYYPWGNRVVNLKAAPGGYVITGHSNQVKRGSPEKYTGGKLALTPLNGWGSYGVSVSTVQYSELTAARLPSGIVILSGMIVGGTITANTVITTLPVGMRPDTDMLFPTMNGTSFKAVVVEAATGNIRIRAGHTASFISLDGIAFPAAGVATWTNVGSGGSAFANSWTSYLPAQFGSPRFWKDPYGLVWLAGAVGGGASTVDNTNIFTLPATHRAAVEQHNTTTSVDGFGMLGARTTDGINWKNGATNPFWISLAGVRLITTDAQDYGVWYSPPMVNSWSNYPGAFTTFGITRREDGLAFAKGLIRAGTISPTIRFAIAPRHTQPEFTQVITRASNGATGRVDISGRESRADAAPGTLYPNQGSNAYIALDGMTWMVG